MTEITRQQERTVIDYMARDYEGLLASMRRLVPTKLPEWKDFEKEHDFGNVLTQLFAHMADILSYYQDRVANESFLGTAQSRRSVIQHLRLIGYRLSTGAPASASLTLSVPQGTTDVVEIARGTAFATKSSADQASVRFEYAAEEPLTIDWGDPSLPVEDGRTLFVGLPVEEGRLIADEILGQSDATVNQFFPLGHPELILRSSGGGASTQRDVILVSELGGTPTEWALAETLAFSREGQHEFVIDVDDQDRATVRFGDGQLGAIPDAGSELRITYRVGGGTQGNVGAGSIQTLVEAPQLALLGAQVTNPGGATGGAARESIEHAVQHAPSVFRSLQRAVTPEDYRALALDFAGVGKVRAESIRWNAVTLFVAPEGGGSVSDVLEANLLAYFEDKRPLSTVIEIEDVDYVSVFVTAEVGVKSYYSRADIEEQARSSAGGLLAFDEVGFGQTLYLSKVYEAIEAIDGVDFVNVTEFRREPPLPDGTDPGTAVASDGRIPLLPSELPRVPDESDYLGGINVVTSGGF